MEYLDNQIEKLNRNYRLFVQKQDLAGNALDEGVVITNPLTVKFEVIRKAYSGIAEATINVYNLGANDYNRLFRDFFFDIDRQKPLFISFSAGYGKYENGKDVLNVIFAGDVYSAYTHREGTDIVTTFYAKTGLRNLAQTISLSIAAGATAKELVAECMSNMPCLSDSYQDIEDYEFKKPVELMGKPLALIKEYNPNRVVYVDLNNVYIQKEDDEGFEGYIPLINDENGLLNAPERKSSTLTFSMIFEPRLLVGQAIEVKSRIAPQFDGQYKIFGITHSGIISDAIGGRAITTVEVNVGPQIYGRFLPK